MERLNDNSKHFLAMYRALVDHFDTQHSQHPFPDPFLIDTTDVTGDDALTREKIQDVLARAFKTNF